MSVIVRLYTFPKRDNSTKIPNSNPVEYTCILKEECGVINPVIILQNIGNPSPYNYAYIPSFSRYYWIREWRWILGRWEADLYTDVLATFRDYIGNSKQYVVRSSHEYDGNITDSLYPTIAIDESAMNTIGAPLAGNLSTGTYVIGIINKNGGYGAVQYFALSASDFVSVCAVMFSANPGWYDLSAIAKTADKLNHMEEGIEASSSDELIPIFTVRYDTTGKATATCDKTYEEILAAIIANKCFRGKVIIDGMQGLEEYYYLSRRSSDDNSDDNFTFEQFMARTSNNKVDVISITRKQIKYHSNGTIEYEYASSRDFE